MRPIDADVLENMGYELHRTYRKDATTMVYEVKKIADVPTIEAEPVRRGRWIHDGYDFQHGNDWIHCSECGKRGINVPADLTNYCPNCGARMEEEEL